MAESLDDFGKWKTTDLKDFLSQRGQSTDGTKAELVALAFAANRFSLPTIPTQGKAKRRHMPVENKVTTESLRGNTAMQEDPNNKTITKTIVMDQIAQLKRDIANDIGEQQLSKCYDVMGQIEDDKIVQAALREVLGPKKFEKYKEQLFYLRMFEMSSAAKS